MKLTQTSRASREGSSRTFFGWQPSCKLRPRLSGLSLAGVILGLFSFCGPDNADAQVTILYNFGSGNLTDGIRPGGGLVQAPDGNFYSTTGAQLGNTGDMFPAGTIYRFDPTTGKVVFVKSFPNTRSHRSPESPLLPFNGGFLGVTSTTNTSGGLIFYLNASGAVEVWHTFGESALSTGGNTPIAPLLVGPDGDIYGATESGGSQGNGLVYKLNPSNHQVQTVHEFSSTGPFSPYRFLLGKDGNFYGVAQSAQGDVIFQMTPAGTVTTLYTPPDFPITLTLMQANDGSFYGTTQFSHIANLYGILFKMTGTPPNVTVTTLHVFGQKKDGKNPGGPVVVGPNGNLYGETFNGGTAGAGTIYEITPDGSTYTILHNFKDGTIPHDGSSPSGGLTLGADNNLYGATAQGGKYGARPFLYGYGTLFKLSP
jgi:uncharacterized repeat protein (TIGR03803 family)